VILQEFLIFEDGSGGEGLDLVRSGSLCVFKPEFIDSETADSSIGLNEQNIVLIRKAARFH
jgi:hypothetical protein